MSSPEAQSGSSSSSEDEFDLGSTSMKSTSDDAKTESKSDPPATSVKTDHSKLFSDEEDDEDDGDGGGDSEAAKKPSTKEEKGSDDEDDSKEKEMEDLFGSDYDSEEEEFKASYVLCNAILFL